MAAPAPPLIKRIPSGVWGLFALFVGLALGTYYPAQFGFIGSGVKTGFTYLARGAPYIIFFTIFAAVSDMMGRGKAGKLAFWVTMTFTGLGLLGGVIGILGAVPLFSLELTRGAESGTFLDMLRSQAGNVLHSSQALMAVLYASLTAILFTYGSKWKPTAWFCQPTRDVVRLVGVDGINLVGRGLKRVFPAILFALGIFIPTAVAAAVGRTETGVGAAGGFETVFGTNPVTLYFLNVGMQVALLAIYISIVITAVLLYTKFPVRAFFRDYFFLTYGFAWATSSSAASIPVTLERTGNGLHVRKEVRDFVVPLGATMNLDGVMVASFTITTFASIIVGYYPTAFDLLLMLIPFKLVTMGVPGIPGGSAAVVPAVAIAFLPFTDPQAAAFTAIWVAFALGLSDQFRTGINTVTNGIVALLFEKLYPKHFVKGGAAPASAPFDDAIDAPQP